MKLPAVGRKGLGSLGAFSRFRDGPPPIYAIFGITSCQDDVSRTYRSVEIYF